MEDDPMTGEEPDGGKAKLVRSWAEVGNVGFIGDELAEWAPLLLVNGEGTSNGRVGVPGFEGVSILLRYASIRRPFEGLRALSMGASGLRLLSVGVGAYASEASVLLSIALKSSAECAQGLCDVLRSSSIPCRSGNGGASLLLLRPAPRSATDRAA